MGRHPNTARDNDILKRLKARETLESIADSYNMTKQRVGQVGREQGHRYTNINDTIICDACGKSFTRNALQIHVDKRYCSRKCAHKKLRKPEGKWSMYGSVKLTCAGCGKEFVRTSKYHSTVLANKRTKDGEHNFCTQKCFGKHAGDFYYMT